MKVLNRRSFLLSAGAVGLTPALAFGQHTGAGEKAGAVASPDFAADVDINLICQRDVVQILKGAPTKVWRYAGELLKGPENTLTPVSGAYLGPTLRFVKGQKIRIRLKNDLPEETIAHWHGLHVPMAADGHSACIRTSPPYTRHGVIGSPGTRTRSASCPPCMASTISRCSTCGSARARSIRARAAVVASAIGRSFRFRIEAEDAPG